MFKTLNNDNRYESLMKIDYLRAKMERVIFVNAMVYPRHITSQHNMTHDLLSAYQFLWSKFAYLCVLIESFSWEGPDLMQLGDREKHRKFPSLICRIQDLPGNRGPPLCDGGIIDPLIEGLFNVKYTGILFKRYLNK